MFFGCLPCCGGGGGACPNHENVGIVGPLAVGFTARIQQPAARYFVPELSTYGKWVGVITDAIDEEVTASSSSSFSYGYRSIKSVGFTHYIFTSGPQTGTATITPRAYLFLPSRTARYPYIQITVSLTWSVGLPTFIAGFYEIPCRQNVSPQADDSKTTITFSAESRPGGGSSTASLFSIESASVHGNALSASAPFPTIPADVPRSPSQPAGLAFSISGDRSSNPNGNGQLPVAPGSLSWSLTFSGYHLSEIIAGNQFLSETRVASTLSVSINSITDANGASASVSAFAPSYSSIPAGPELIP